MPAPVSLGSKGASPPRPLLWLGACFASGVGFGLHLGPLSVTLLVVAVGGLSAVGLGFVVVASRWCPSFSWRAVLVHLVVVLAGLVAGSRASQPHTPLRQWAPWLTARGRVVRLRGVVESIRPPPGVVAANGRSRLYLGRVEVLGARESPLDHGVVEVSLEDTRAVGMLPGVRIEASCYLRGPQPARNPGDFDELEWCRRLGVVARGRVLSGPDAVRVLEAGFHPGRTVARLRAHLLLSLRGAAGPLAGNFLAASLLGVSESVSPALRSAFRRTGTVHLLVVSGLHVAIVVFLIWMATAPLALFGMHRSRAIVCLVALALYVLLVGSRPPVMRAAFMAFICIVARAQGRPVDSFQAVGAGLLGVLLLDPGAFQSPGFQLSFVAVTAVLLHPFCGPRSQSPSSELAAERESRVGVLRWLLSFVGNVAGVSLAAVLATSPLLSLHFGMVTPGAIVVNVLVLPLFTVLMISGALSALLAAVWVPMGVAPGLVADCVARVIVWVVETAAGVPGCAVRVWPAAWWVVALSYLGLGLAVWCTRRQLRLWYSLVLALASILMVCVVPVSVSAPPQGGLRLAVVNLGRQRCLVVEGRGRVVVIQRGRELSVGSAHSLGRVIRALGCEKVDLAVLSVARGEVASVRQVLEQWVVVVDVWDNGGGRLDAGRFWAGGGAERVPGWAVWETDMGELVLVVGDGDHRLLFTAGVSDTRLGGLCRLLNLQNGDLIVHPHPQARLRRQRRFRRFFGAAGVVVAGGAVSSDARRVFRHRLVTPDGAALRLSGAAQESWTLERWSRVGGYDGWLEREWLIP